MKHTHITYRWNRPMVLPLSVPAIADAKGGQHHRVELKLWIAYRLCAHGPTTMASLRRHRPRKGMVKQDRIPEVLRQMEQEGVIVRTPESPTDACYTCAQVCGHPWKQRTGPQWRKVAHSCGIRLSEQWKKMGRMWCSDLCFRRYLATMASFRCIRCGVRHIAYGLPKDSVCVVCKANAALVTREFDQASFTEEVLNGLHRGRVRDSGAAASLERRDCTR